MHLGEKIKQLRKLSGMTQEQLAEKLNVSRQALSKWENESSMPDIESVVKISGLFQISLDELLCGEEKQKEADKTQLTLEDLANINLHNRKMNLLSTTGILFLAIGIMMAVLVGALQSTTISISYTLYRYIATGQYAAAPVDYFRLWLPSVLIIVIGVILCICYFVKSRKD